MECSSAGRHAGPWLSVPASQQVWLISITSSKNNLSITKTKVNLKPAIISLYFFSAAFKYLKTFVIYGDDKDTDDSVKFNREFPCNSR